MARILLQTVREALEAKEENIKALSKEVKTQSLESAHHGLGDYVKSITRNRIKPMKKNNIPPAKTLNQGTEVGLLY